MSSVIYYFSGTGNSLAVARDIAARLGAELNPITSCLGKGRVSPDADVVGIVFPVYYEELPMIVEEFARKLGGLEGKYIFAVCTFGGAAGLSLGKLRRIIRSGGGKLNAAYGVRMPQNSFLKRREDKQTLYERWKARLELIVKNTEARAKGTYYPDPLMEWLLTPVFAFIVRPVCIRHFKKLSNLPSDATYERHKHAVDGTFSVTDQCGGCGACSRVCPVGNIRMEAGKPMWLGRCEHCLACYSWCPRKAIRGGITSGYYYRHPGVGISEITAQRRDCGKTGEESKQFTVDGQPII